MWNHEIPCSVQLPPIASSEMVNKNAPKVIFQTYAKPIQIYYYMVLISYNFKVLFHFMFKLLVLYESLLFSFCSEENVMEACESS